MTDVPERIWAHCELGDDNEWFIEYLSDSPWPGEDGGVEYVRANARPATAERETIEDILHNTPVQITTCGFIIEPYATDLARAILEALPPAPVWRDSVKPLKWVPCSSDGTTFKASARLVSYTVWEMSGYGYLAEGSKPGQKIGRGIESAKAEAQSMFVKLLSEHFEELPAAPTSQPDAEQAEFDGKHLLDAQPAEQEGEQ